MNAPKTSQNLLEMYTLYEDTRKNIEIELLRICALANKVIQSFLESETGFKGSAMITEPGTDKAEVNVIVCPHQGMIDISPEEQQITKTKQEKLRQLLKDATGYTFHDGPVFGPTDPYIRLRLGPTTKRV